MNTLARVLAAFLVIVFLDAAGGFGLYRDLVHAATGAYCSLTNRTSFERYDCTSRVFYSQRLWLLISVLMGLSGGYVTLNALSTGKW